MNMLKGVFLIFVLSLLQAFVLKGFGQDTLGYSSMSVHYAYHLPQSDMRARFLNNSALGVNYEYVSPKKWTFTLSGAFLFRDTVRENQILDGLKTATGYIIDGNGELADIYLFERGYFASFSMGKQWFVFSSPALSLCASLGLGFIQHKILIQDGKFTVPQLSDEYKKGYDRLTNGLLLHQTCFLRYRPQGRSISFFAGLEAVQGFTKNRRSFNFDTMERDTKNRLDILAGPKIGLTVIFRKSTPEPFYFY